MAIPGLIYGSVKERKRLRRLQVSRKSSPQVTCLSPIDEDEMAEGCGGLDSRYMGPITLLRSPALEVITPYDCSETGARNLRKIMYYYTTAIVGSSICAGPKRRFFPASLQDETLFHAMIFSSAIHASWCQGVPTPPEVYEHRALAIRLVNEKLNAKFIEPTAFDSMINTIYFLLITESFIGSPESLRIHWDGLIHLIQMAGGLKSLGLSGITRRNALWADLSVAMVLKESPRLHPPCPNIQLLDYFGLHSPGTSCIATAFGARIYVFTGSRELSQQASTAFWGLRSVSQLQNVRKMEAFIDTAGPDDIQYSDRAETLERVLVPLWSIKDGDCKRASILRMFAWAALIYLYANLRDVPKGMSIYELLAKRILGEMDKCCELDAVYETFPDLMLWILFQGGQSATVDIKPYFARAAAKSLAAQHMSEEADIKAASQAFLWPVDKAAKPSEMH